MGSETEKRVHIVSADQTSYSGLRDRVESYVEKGGRHVDRIPFLFLEEWEGELPDESPEWVSSHEQLGHLWNVAKHLSDMYRFWLQQHYAETSSSLASYIKETFGDRRRNSEPSLPDERMVVELSEQSEKRSGYAMVKKWRDLMKTFQRTAELQEHHARTNHEEKN